MVASRRPRQVRIKGAWRGYVTGNRVVARDLGDGRMELRHPMGGTTVMDRLDFQAFLHEEDVQVCARCGCHDLLACDEGCEWIAPNLCSACTTPEASE